MTKEKYNNLIKYVNDLKNKLGGQLPAKHKNRKVAYHQFLNREIEQASKKIEDMRLAGVDAKSK